MLIEVLPAGRRINANRKQQTIQYPKPKLYLQCDLRPGCQLIYTISIQFGPLTKLSELGKPGHQSIYKITLRGY